VLDSMKEGKLVVEPLGTGGAEWIKESVLLPPSGRRPLVQKPPRTPHAPLPMGGLHLLPIPAQGVENAEPGTWHNMTPWKHSWKEIVFI
jgi:hypothetical protein